MGAFATIIGFIQASMPELNSGSVAAIVSKEAEAVGQAIDNTIAELTNTQDIITGIINDKNFGHSEYYTDAALAYQDGVDLSVDPITKKFYYATIDTTKQIISQAAFEAVTSGSSVSLTLKVATLDTGTGLLIKLTPTQKAAFDSYFGNFEIPGLPMTKISNDPNIIDFDAAISYDKTYDLTTIQSNVLAALDQFRNTFTFNGKFYNYYLESYLVANVPGVKAVYLSNTAIDAVAFSGSTSLSAGYFNYGTTSLNYASI
jgi:hypothetical protein